MRRWPVERSYRHQEVGLLKMAHHRLGAAQLAKLGEQMEQPRVHFFIGIKANPAIATIRQPGRQRHSQLASRRLLPLALMQPQLNLMKFSLAHDPGQAEQQTVMIGARIVHALDVPDFPRSSSMTSIRSFGHPNKAARSTSRYCSSVLS